MLTEYAVKGTNEVCLKICETFFSGLSLVAVFKTCVSFPIFLDAINI